MGLIDRLGRSAGRHAHVLVIEIPGHWQTRAAVERAALARGWNLAPSPADADVLAVCGEPGRQIGEAVKQVWHQMPGPRVRVDVRLHDDVAACLDDAYAGLLDTARHRHDAHSRPTAQDLLADIQADEHGGMDHGDVDHGDMDMSPGGIPLADGAQDRDGLEMDVLHVRLGPVLPHWPAGLVLRCALQGDVVTEAKAEFLDAATQAHIPSWTAPARRMDNICALLALAGWDDAAAEARAIRDFLLKGDQDFRAAARTVRLVRRVRRSWVLRWSLRGIGPLLRKDLQRHGLSADLAGDTHDRLLRMLDRAAPDVTAGHSGDSDRRLGDDPAPAHGRQGHSAAASAEDLGHVVTGLDLAAARLVIASLDLHELRAGHAEPEVSHA